MRGYKVFNPNWTCRGRQYSCPGEFWQEGELKLYENGIHFCLDLMDCFAYYSFNAKNKVAEIEVFGEVMHDDDGTSCANHIKIIREIPWNEVLAMVNDGEGNTGIRNVGRCNVGRG